MYYLDREGLTFLINRIKQWISSFNKADTPVSGSYVTSVSESDGVISVTREAADTVPTANSTKMITSGGVKSALPTKVSELTNDSGYITSSAIGALDVSSVGGSGEYIQSISETDGKISATAATMPTSLPASDVYSWAKASTKPTYTASEVGASATGHTHDERYYTETEMDTKLNAKLNTSLKGAASGVAELDANGLVPSSQLPSYVDDVLEYSSKTSFPSTGETGKIYVDTSTNLTWRWSGSTYVEISPSLALGTTSSTAYRGDYGDTAYTHATDSSKLTTATATGLYKVGSTANGHISGLDAVTKADITGLGIPGQDTTYDVATTTTSGLMNATDKVKLNGIQTGAQVNQPAFSRIYVNSQTVEADSTTDVLTLTAGNNVTLTPDTTNDAVTITATDTTYSAGTGLSLSGTTINHSNSVTSGTIGTASNTSGYDILIPYAKYDSEGHITAKGTHTHTLPTPKIVFNAFGDSSNVYTNTTASYGAYNYMSTWSSITVEDSTYIYKNSNSLSMLRSGLYYVRANVAFKTTGQVNRLKKAKITLKDVDQLIVTRRLELTSSSSSSSVWEDITVEGFIQVASSGLMSNTLQVWGLDESGSASWYVEGLQIVYIG